MGVVGVRVFRSGRLRLLSCDYSSDEHMDAKVGEHGMEACFVSRMYDMAPVCLEHKYRATSHLEARIALVSFPPHYFKPAHHHSYKAWTSLYTL
jgi:hypothetical protein